MPYVSVCEGWAIWEIVVWSEVLRSFLGCGWGNSYEYRGFCVVYSWQNGTRCRDGVKKYCGVVHVLFGWFLRVSSLHVLVCAWQTFL